MPPTTAMRQTIPDQRVWGPEAWHDARLIWFMPGANHLTRAITAAILETHGLLEEQPAERRGRIPPDAVASRRARLLRAKALGLRRELEQLCAEAAALCREAECLCTVRVPRATLPHSAIV